MVNRRSTPNRAKSFVAPAASFAASACFASPAMANVSDPLPCPKSEKATLEVRATELVATSASHDIPFTSGEKSVAESDASAVNSLTLLAPRAEAAIREAFNESGVEPLESSDVSPPMAGLDTKVESASAGDEDMTPVTGLKTRLPGTSDDDLSKFKKRMFRRDI